MNGHHLRGRELDIDVRQRPHQALSAWEARIQAEERQQAEDRRMLLAGAFWGLVFILVVMAVLAAGPAPAR